MAESVIVAGARTPIGKLSGALAGFSAMDLGGLAIAGHCSRAGVGPEQVDYVLMGQVILAGQGQITARQAAAKAGIPMTVPATTINKVCLSGLNTIYLADQMIRAGDAEIVVAGGMESMTQAPAPAARGPRRATASVTRTLVDSMMFDGLTCAFDHCAMGLSTERYNQTAGISRERQDAFSARQPREGGGGHQGRPARRGDRPGVDAPAQGRPARRRHRRGRAPGTRPPSRSARCGPPSTRPGTITAGNASQISDGGAAVVVMSKAKAAELGLEPARRAPRLRPGRRPGHLAAHASPRTPSPRPLAKAGVDVRRRRPLRDQRGLRRRRAGLGGRPRHRRGQGQRERRRHRARPPRRACRGPAWR